MLYNYNIQALYYIKLYLYIHILITLIQESVPQCNAIHVRLTLFLGYIVKNKKIRVITYCQILHYVIIYCMYIMYYIYETATMLLQFIMSSLCCKDHHSFFILICCYSILTCVNEWNILKHVSIVLRTLLFISYYA